MSVPSQSAQPNLLDSDLSSLAERLELEMGHHNPPSTTAQGPKNERLALSAPPEAVLTLGLGICAGAVWLARALPY